MTGEIGTINTIIDTTGTGGITIGATGRTRVEMNGQQIADMHDKNLQETEVASDLICERCSKAVARQGKMFFSIWTQGSNDQEGGPCV
jgi:hypothetical protein